MIGRFQPFTKGHYKCVEAAKNLKNIPTVICMIDVPENKVNNRHPFPTDTMIDLYTDLFNNDPNIENVVKVKSADIVKIGELLKDLGYNISSWSCGTDRFNEYNKMATKYRDQAGLSDDFEVIEVPRSDEDISATKVRESLLNNDRKSFDKMMPSGSTFDTDTLYHTLKSQIEKVYNISEGLSRLESRVNDLERLIYL